MRSQVLMAESMKIVVFWVVAPCKSSHVSEVLAASTICVIIALMIEAAGTFETSVNFYQTTQHNNPENSQPSSLITMFGEFSFMAVYLEDIWKFLCRHGGYG
jgi:hypothetical protein